MSEPKANTKNSTTTTSRRTQSPLQLLFLAMRVYSKIVFYLLRASSPNSTESQVIQKTCTEYLALTLAASTIALFFNFNNLHLLIGLVFGLFFYKQLQLDVVFGTFFGVFGLVSGVLSPSMSEAGIFLYPVFSTVFLLYFMYVNKWQFSIDLYLLESVKVFIYILAYFILPYYIPAFLLY